MDSHAEFAMVYKSGGFPMQPSNGNSTISYHASFFIERRVHVVKDLTLK